MSAHVLLTAHRARFAPLLALPLALLTLSACQQRATSAGRRGGGAAAAVAYESHVAAGGRVPPGGTLHNPHRVTRRSPRAAHCCSPR